MAQICDKINQVFLQLTSGETLLQLVKARKELLYSSCCNEKVFVVVRVVNDGVGTWRLFIH